MEQRQHFRVSDFLAIEIFDGDKRVFPRAIVRDHSLVQARHEDLLKAVFRGLKKARAAKMLGTEELKSILSGELADTYITLEDAPDDATKDSKRCHTSLSEGGIRIDVPTDCYNPDHGSRLSLSLHLGDNAPPLNVRAYLKGTARVETDNVTMLRFEFISLSEFSRQRLFRYILKQQSKKVRTQSDSQLGHRARQ